MKRIFIGCFSAVILFLSGCPVLRNTHQLVCDLPPLPAVWSDRSWDDGFRLIYRTETGEMEELDYSAFPASLSVSLPRGVNIPVLVYPAGGTIPAGAVVPRDINNQGNLTFSWESGWAALLFFRLSSEWGVVKALNAERLISEADRVGGGDPWTLDMEYAMRSLSYGRFSLYALSPLETRSLSVPTAPGCWISDNPFRGPVQAGDGGVLEFTALEKGFHRFRSGEGENVLDLYVGDDYWSAVNRSTGSAVSGTW